MLNSRPVRRTAGGHDSGGVEKLPVARRPVGRLVLIPGLEHEHIPQVVLPVAPAAEMFIPFLAHQGRAQKPFPPQPAGVAHAARLTLRIRLVTGNGEPKVHAEPRSFAGTESMT